MSTQAEGAFLEARRRINACCIQRSPELHLGNLGLTQIPDQVWECSWVQMLRLHNNRLVAIPKHIAELKELRSLIVRDNQLRRIPAEIRSLTQLHDLHLGRNRLTDLPDIFKELAALEELSLIGNKITDLPKSLGQGSKLRVLWYAKNSLRTVPDGVFRLRRLQFLYLYENALHDLPETFRRLTDLVELDVSKNKLSSLPSSIRYLRNLRQLNLIGNRFDAVPKELRRLRKLQRLYLHDNNLDIPDEILGSRPEETSDDATPSQEILRYYFVTAPLEKRPLNEAKLILVGRGGAGKTSIRKRLISGDFDQGEDKTAGIAVVRWLLPLLNDDVRLNVWDFGGQEIMHATHQFFLTKRSLYLLVLNAREGEQDANIDYWLKLIEAYGASSPAIVVINKCAEHILDVDERGLRQKFPFIRGFARTDCHENVGIAELRNLIERYTDELPDLRTPFPKTWFGIKEQLETMQDDCITYDAYQAVCAHASESDTGNQEVLIDFLNDLGSVLHFSDADLFDLGVLKPEWVTEGIYGLLNSEELKSRHGVLEIDQVGAILDAGRYPKQRHRYLISLMEKFELCFEIPNATGKKYLIPELLPKATPENVSSTATTGIQFEYHYNILPEGLLPRFIVRTHSLSEGCARWRHGVELKNREAKALIRADVQEKRISVAVTGPARKPRELLAIIRHQFEEIHRGIKGMTADEKVPVPGFPSVKLDYRKLLVREANEKTTVEFETDTESIEVPLGALLDNFEEISSRKARTQFIVQTGGVLNYMTNQERYDFSHSQIANSVVGAHMANITNAIQQQAGGEQRVLLEKLAGEVKELMSKLPADKQEEASGDLEQLVKGVTAATPNRRWYSVSAEGLLEASKFAKDFTANIAGTIGQLGKLIWPDFSLPKTADQK